MRWPNEYALTPTSLATDGNQGEEAALHGLSEAQDTARGILTLILARMALDVALAQLEAYALTTDDPIEGSVEAADLLTAARKLLGGAA